MLGSWGSLYRGEGVLSSKEEDGYFSHYQNNEAITEITSTVVVELT
jgi:hypothetical protein